MDTKVQKLVKTINEFKVPDSPWNDCNKYLEIHTQGEQFKDLFIHYKDVMVLIEFIKRLKKECSQIQLP